MSTNLHAHKKQSQKALKQQIELAEKRMMVVAIMKALTLNEFIDNKVQQDYEFAKHYEREQIIDEIYVSATLMEVRKASRN